ncbi:CPBP family intramembrane metalloprotease [Rothia sp. AR01]|uniref:CPBP family intramembrane metalloprotease n=1 Tax=Rothia santali TaxID=2949643 RepID=A0A9X2KIT0_9MICC|nr:type II CAAX endopeptidase family protein [Rothia santali]MCP3426370.1 CPBP family intramembrane metalloprotease [Rothia santali]
MHVPVLAEEQHAMPVICPTDATATGALSGSTRPLLGTLQRRPTAVSGPASVFRSSSRHSRKATMTTTPDPTLNQPSRASSSVDGSRPFGAHLSMRWWVPLVLTIIVVAAIYGLQLLFGALAAIVEFGLLGKDPDDSPLTPLPYLATNLAIILVAPLTLLLLAKMGRVPWRSALSLGRAFSRRRLATYLGLFAALMVLANAAVQLINPSPLSLFAVSGTTITLLAVVVVTTPLQAAAEEIAFRGVLTASYASWVRASGPALIVGITGSSVLFSLVHTSTDPWMILNYLGLGASTAVMALISRGLEAPIAFHVMNNVFAMGIGALFAEGDGIAQDRSAGAGGPYMLVFLVAELVAVAVVWLLEKRRRRNLR